MLAHIKCNGNVRVEQSWEEHSRNTAFYAGKSLKGIGLYHVGILAGLLHDMGKGKEEFQVYLEKSAAGEKVKRGSVNHTFGGVIYLLENYHSKENDRYARLTSEVIAYAIGAHHGLFDIITINGEDEFLRRVEKDKKEIGYDECVNNFFDIVESEEKIQRLYLEAVGEVKIFISKIVTSKRGSKSLSFQFGLLTRLVTSAVVHGDRMDTAEFMLDNQLETEPVTKEFWKQQLEFLEEKIQKFNRTSTINIARGYISDECKAFATNGSGVYRCTVPTGGGKTLATLRYTYEHARIHNKKRVIYIIPLLSVLEQNSEVIKNYCTDPLRILEHHSNVVRCEEVKEVLDEYEFLTETWSEPIIISTMVRFLEMLFQGRMTNVRRFQALTESVIIIDESQTIPKKTLYMFNEAMNFLSRCCNSTIVLCSATQPTLGELKRSIVFSNPVEMVTYDEQIWSAFKRTIVKNIGSQHGWEMDQITEFVLQCMEERESLLMICNTKQTTLEIYQKVQNMVDDEIEVFHLSTTMCMAHRIDTLSKIREILKSEFHKKIICISTQLIEAGVDISFECVIRAQAGLDNIAQANGRCNRNGEYEGIKDTYVVKVKDENLKRLREIETSQLAYLNLLEYINNRENVDFDLLDQTNIEQYFNLLFGIYEKGKEFYYPVLDNVIQGLSVTLYDLLSLNEVLVQSTSKRLDVAVILSQSFASAGKLFQVFDENTQDVIVPYNEQAKAIIQELLQVDSKYELAKVKELCAKAKPYMVSLYSYQYEALDKNGWIEADVNNNRFTILKENAYNQEIGVCNHQDIDLFIVG